MLKRILLASGAAAVLAIGVGGDRAAAAQGASGNAPATAAPGIAPSNTPLAASPSAATTTGATNPTSADGYVKQAAISDLFEVQSSRVALEKAQRQDVKAFAQQMIDQHTATTAQLKRTLSAAEVDATPPTQLDAAHEAKLKALKSAGGSAFDSTYVQQQVIAHEQAVALHQGYASAGDNPQLQQFASEMAPKVQHHLQMARALGASGS
jgi:putative membrane protein